MDAELLQGFYLKDLLVEPLKGQVTGRRGSTHVAPKAIEVLLCLAGDPGELVTRETLLACAWGEDQGSAEALSRAVSELRQAFDDHHDDPSFIQTIPRRGYRLLVTPELVSEATSSVVLGHKDGARVTDIGVLENLQRRGVIETAIAYLILGWLLIQIADIVFARLLLPDWTATFVTFLVIAGFPIALVLSWFLEFRHGRAVLDKLSPADARKRRFSRTYVSIVGALGIAAIGVYVYDQSIGLPQAETETLVAAETRYEPPPIVENSIAVLPFLNLDGTDETRIFANGLVEDVTTNLSRVPGLHVAARGDAFSLAPNSPSEEVRRRLRVQMYLEGSVEMAGDEMRVTVQMIDAESGFHILSRRFQKLREDFFDVRDEITSLTVANVRVALPPDVRAWSLKAGADPSLDAYVLYRRGIEATREPWSVDTIASALGWFDAALNVDPEYAAAHAGRCYVYAEGYSEVDDPGFIDNAERACATALQLNPNLDIVHTALGDLYRSTGRYDDAEWAYQKALEIDPNGVEPLKGLGEIYARQNRFDVAESNLRRAVDIHPGDASTYNTLGMFLYQTGRFEEAAQQYEYVVALQPDNMNGYANLGAARTLTGDFLQGAIAYKKAIGIQPTKSAHSGLGMMNYYLGDYDDAIENLASAIILQPNDHLARSNLGDALWVAGREDEARGEFEKAETLALSAFDVNPNDPFTMMDLAWIRAMLDKNDEARRLIDRALELAPDDPYTHYYNALVHLRAGDEDEALDALELAAEKGYSLKLLAAEPHLEPLRKRDRFVAIVETVDESG